MISCKNQLYACQRWFNFFTPLDDFQSFLLQLYFVLLILFREIFGATCPEKGSFFYALGPFLYCTIFQKVDLHLSSLVSNNCGEI